MALWCIMNDLKLLFIFDFFLVISVQIPPHPENFVAIPTPERDWECENSTRTEVMAFTNKDSEPFCCYTGTPGNTYPPMLDGGECVRFCWSDRPGNVNYAYWAPTQELPCVCLDCRKWIPEPETPSEPEYVEASLLKGHAPLVYHFEHDWNCWWDHKQMGLNRAFKDPTNDDRYCCSVVDDPWSFQVSNIDGEDFYNPDWCVAYCETYYGKAHWLPAPVYSDGLVKQCQCLWCNGTGVSHPTHSTTLPTCSKNCTNGREVDKYTCDCDGQCILGWLNKACKNGGIAKDNLGHCVCDCEKAADKITAYTGDWCETPRCKASDYVLSGGKNIAEEVVDMVPFASKIKKYIDIGSLTKACVHGDWKDCVDKATSFSLSQYVGFLCKAATVVIPYAIAICKVASFGCEMINTVLKCKSGKEHSMCGLHSDVSRITLFEDDDIIMQTCMKPNSVVDGWGNVTKVSCALRFINKFAEYMMDGSEFTSVMDVLCYLDHLQNPEIGDIRECALGEGAERIQNQEKILQYLYRRNDTIMILNSNPEGEPEFQERIAYMLYFGNSTTTWETLVDQTQLAVNLSNSTNSSSFAGILVHKNEKLWGWVRIAFVVAIFLVCTTILWASFKSSSHSNTYLHLNE